MGEGAEQNFPRKPGSTIKIDPTEAHLAPAPALRRRTEFKPTLQRNAGRTLGRGHHRHGNKIRRRDRTFVLVRFANGEITVTAYGNPCSHTIVLKARFLQALHMKTEDTVAGPRCLGERKLRPTNPAGTEDIHDTLWTALVDLDLRPWPGCCEYNQGWAGTAGGAAGQSKRQAKRNDHG